MPSWPERNADPALRAATFRLVDPAGGFAGTGFLVSPDQLITCHHVVAGGPSVSAIDGLGQVWSAEAESLNDSVLVAADIAIVRLSGTVNAEPLPLSFTAPGSGFSSRVQLSDGRAFQESTPIQGELLGPSRIGYAHGELGYEVEAHPVKGAWIKGGMSGAAAWDADASAVCGLVAVRAADENLGGFVIPLVRGRASEALAKLLAANQATVARYGMHPNRLGLEAQMSMLNDRTLKRLKARGIVSQAAFVPREGWDAKVGAFLETDKTALAIVSAAGQGKTNLLVEFVGRPERPPAWLVRAADFSAAEPPRAALNRLLRDGEAPTGFSWPEMADACEVRPILLLDGLNEAPIEEGRLSGEWMPDLLAEASTAGWRVIYTTRPTLFAKLNGDAGGEVFALGRYTAGEARLAAAAYGVLGRTVEREPLQLRIRAEVGPGTGRAEVLEQFISHLLLPSRSATHPGALLDRLAELAERTARKGGGIASYNDPFFAEQAVTDTLCKANLLEMVPAGYRFVFDEVADYLHARRIAGDLVNKPALKRRLLQLSPSVLALAVEVLSVAGQTDASAKVATEFAEIVASSNLALSTQAFLALSALPLSPEFEPAKMQAAAAAAADEHLQHFALTQPGLLSALPLDGVRLLAREAILDQHGYGWREKDIWSEQHRGSTVRYARMERGIFRLIHDLLDDPHVDGAGLLIDWLSDTTALSNDSQRYANSEATVGTFALCMLFAYRELVGIDRLFRDVLWARRPGYDALLQALAAEDTEPLAVWLETLPPEEAVQRPDWVRRAWAAVLENLRKPHGESADVRVADAMARLVPHASGENLGQLVQFVIWQGLPLEKAASLAQWAMEAGFLDAYSLAAAIRRQLVSATDALSTTDKLSRDATALQLVGAWRPGAVGPSVEELVHLIRATEFWLMWQGPGRCEFESLLWQIDMRTAQTSGVDGLVSELLEGLHAEEAAGFLVNTGFAGTWRNTTDGQLEFRSWIADKITPFLSEHGLEDAIKRSLEDRATFERCRPFAIELAGRATSQDLMLVMLGCSDPYEQGLREVIEAYFSTDPDREDPYLSAMGRALAMLVATKDAPLLRSALHDLAFEALFGTRENQDD
jgi:hypothetical protein